MINDQCSVLCVAVKSHKRLPEMVAIHELKSSFNWLLDRPDLADKSPRTFKVHLTMMGDHALPRLECLMNSIRVLWSFSTDETRLWETRLEAFPNS